MARLSNEEIQNMTLAEARAYTDLHPAEAWRFAKADLAASAEQTKKAAKYGLKTGIFAPAPEMLEMA